MIIVGLTGGIGSGKSTISKYLKKKKIPVFDSDKEEKNQVVRNTFFNRGWMGLVLILMMFTSITLLGLWEKKRSRKRFQEAVRKLKELEAMTLTKAIK